MGPLVIEAYRYHRWANLHLLGVCVGLTEAQLQFTSPGTYGTIQDTLMHLVGAEQRYVSRLGGSRPRINERSAFPGVEALTRHAARTGEDLIDMARHIRAGEERVAKFRDGRYKLQPGVILIQALHHGNDHRTHICTILGAHGIEYGDMDVWSYGAAVGALERIGGR